MSPVLTTRFLRDIFQDIKPKRATLADLVAEFRKNSISESLEIINEQRICQDDKIKQEAGKTWYWTSNISGVEYTQDGTIDYYLGNKTAFNKIINSSQESISDFCKQLLDFPNLCELSSRKQKAMHSLAKKGYAVKVKSADLNLQGRDQECGTAWRYFEIETAHPEKLNESQIIYAAPLYGKTDEEFKANMDMFAQIEIPKIRICVPNPKYIKEHIPKGKAVVGACLLYYFDNDAYFYAGNWEIDCLNFALRGILKKSPKEVMHQK